MEEGRCVCVFSEVLDTCDISKKFDTKELSQIQKNTIDRCSKERQDDFNETIVGVNQCFYHKDCYAAYTSSEKIARYLRKKKAEEKCHGETDSSPPPKKLRSFVGPTFNYLKLCMFCGESCDVEKDTKHPGRWEKNPGVLCRTADRGKDKYGRQRKEFKEVLLEVCDRRDDILADTVRIRLQGATSDLHAADGRYHKNCYSDFVSERSIKAAHNKYDQISSDKEPFNFVIRSIRNEPERIWNATELHNAYTKRGGTDSRVARITSRIKQQLKDEIYCFNSPGISTVIMHQKKASGIFKIVNTTDRDDGKEIKIVADKIVSEIKDFPIMGNTYPVLDSDEISEICLPTLQTLLSLISPKFSMKVVALISGMVSTISKSKTSILQVALGLLVHEKRLIEHLYEYGVVASYDEVRRFKISSAAENRVQLKLESRNGLIQGISDNFDAHLNTQNGLKQTHSLATIITQQSRQNPVRREPIKRLKKSELSKLPLEDIEMKIYAGEKKPVMPETHAKIGVLPLRVLCHQVIITRKSKEDDFGFILDSVTLQNTPDYSGYNTREKRITGQSMK